MRPIRRWLLIVVVVVGLVGMHHLVDAGMDRPTTPSPMMTTGPTATATTPTVIGRVVTGPMATDASAADGVGGSAVVAHPAMTMDMHMCLAILVALVLLGAILAVVATIGRRGDPVGRRGIVVIRPPPRPTPVRLAQLCVLRT